MLKLFSIIIGIFVLFLVTPACVFAYNVYSFTASGILYDSTSSELKFTASSISHTTTAFNHGGISSCNTDGCGGDYTEFWNSMNIPSYSDPINFDQTLVNNSYRPSAGIVYVWLGDGVNRWYSQPLNYDDIVVSPISLNVPLFKQGISPFNDNSPLWEGEEFDHANTGQFYCGNTMAQCGCATTSVAMLLNYHGVNKLPNGEILDPGTLNNWLKNNHGYNRNLGIKWGVAATVAHKAKFLNPDFQYDALEVDRDWTYSPIQLKNDLEQGIPSILQENTPQGMHFVVATGIDNNAKFTINDPFHDRISLSSYGDTAASMRRFVPANSDISYISLAVDEGVSILVKDHNGILVGNAYFDYGPGNPAGEGNPSISSSLNILEYDKPQTGSYTIELESGEVKNFQLDITFITQTGEIKTQSIKGIIDADVNELFTISFDKQLVDNSEMQKNVTFDSMIADIKELRQLRHLHFATALMTTALVRNTEKLHEKGNNEQAVKLIDVTIEVISKSSERFVDPVAEEILLYDLKELKTILQQ